MRYKWRSSLSHHEGLHRKAKDFRLKPRRRRKSTATAIALPTVSVPVTSPLGSLSPSAVPTQPQQVMANINIQDVVGDNSQQGALIPGPHASAHA